MSSGEPTARALVDFFLFDEARLVESDVDGARDLVHTFHFRLRRAESPSSDIGVLQRIANAIGSELEGEIATARRAYEALAASPDPIERLVGLALCAWASDATTGDENRFASFVAGSKLPGRLKAAAFGKLMTWRWERGNFDGTQEAFDAAIRYARGNHLRALHRVEPWLHGVLRPSGAVTTAWIAQPNVIELLAESAAEELETRLKENVRSPWTRTTTFGGVPNRRAEAAMLQASWAGALWLIPEIRRHLATRLLLSPRHEGNAERGTILWISSGGGNAADIVRRHEPYFQAGTATKLYQLRSQLGPFMVRPAGWHEIFLAVWDEFDDATVHALIDQIPVSTIDATTGTPADSAGNSLFSVLYLLDPPAWTRRFSTLTDAEKLGLAPTTSPFVLAHMPDDIPQQLLDLVFDVLEHGTPSSGLWATLPVLIGRSAADDNQARIRVRALLDRAPQFTAVDIAEVSPGITPADRLRAVVASLSEQVTQDLHAAARGTYNVYARDPHLTLGKAVAVGGGPKAPVVDLLIQTLQANRTAVDDKQAAVQGLTEIARRRGITRKVVDQIRETRVKQPVSHWSSNPDDEVRLLEVLKVACVSAAGHHAPSDTTTLIVAARDPLTRIRITALDALAQHGDTADAAVQATFLSALFDPDANVQRYGVRAIKARLANQSELRDAVIDRLRRMWPDAPTTLRIEIAHAARTLGLADVLDLAASDRSWQVRHAATADGMHY